MKTVYLDPVDFKCHTVQNADETLVPYATDFFDGKCDTFIEGYRLIPFGCIWTNEDGIEFAGEMVTPWKSYTELLEPAQRLYELALIADMQNALNKLGVTLDE